MVTKDKYYKLLDKDRFYAIDNFYDLAIKLFHNSINGFKFVV